MQTIGAMEARANFAALLRRVSEQRERIVIERRGKPRVAVVPVEDLEQDGDTGEHALRESEQRFRDFVDASSDWFWEMDENCRFSYFSDRFTEVTGVPHEALLGKTREETGIPGVDPVVWQRHLADLAARRSFRDFRHSRILPDGREVQLSINGKAVFDRAGNFKGYRGTGTDITESMQTEKSLRETNALFNETEHLAKLGHWEWDEIEDRCVYCSEELARMHGITVEEFLERASSFEANLDLIHPADRERYYQVATEATQGRKGFEIECRLVQPNGDVLEVREVAEPVLDQQGRLIRSIGFVQDISGRKRTEQALRESEERFRGVFDLGLIGMAILSPAGHFQQVNGAYCKILGSSKEELIGRHFNQVIHPDDLESVTARLRQLLAGEVEGYHHERRYRHKNGHDIWGLAGLFVLRNPDGSPQDFVVQVLETTERRRAEEALQESEERFRNLVEGSIEGIMIHRGFKPLFVNEAFAKIFGFDRPEEVLALDSVLELAPPLEAARAKGYAAARLRGDDAPTEYEYEGVTKDGSTIWLDNLMRVVSWMGEPAIQSTVVEITERKRAEEELRRARDDLELRVQERTADLQLANEALRGEEAKLREILDNSPIGVAIVSYNIDGTRTTGDRLFINNAMVQMFGAASRESLIHAKIEDSWVDKEQLKAVEEILKSGRELVNFEVQRRRMDGTLWWSSMSTRSIRFNDQDCTMVWHFDITERKRAEEELRESEERYRELFDESPVAIWVEDWSPIKRMLDDLARGGVKDWRGYFNSHRDQLKTAYDLGEILEISRATIKLYRKESQEHMEQMTVAAVVLDEELDAFGETLLAFLAGQTAFEIESEDTAGDGSEIIVRRRVVIPPKYRDDWSRVIYAIEDITERVRVEEQLRQAQKMEATGQLTGGVAHDFNNLLAIVLGNTEMLSVKVGVDDPKIQAVIRAVKRGAELTGRLLAFSRKQTLQPQAVDVNALIGGMIDLLGRTLGETIEIKTSSAPGLWLSEVDLGQLENALLNLAINARDAMPQGGALVIEAGNASLDEAYARNHADVTAGDYVMLAVSDSGSGMSPEILEHALEPFFTTKDIGEGSGLGLSMVYGFAKQSGGHVAIYSEQGHGTMVKLYLPRAGAETVPAGEETATEAPRARGETVLVVEDDADVRQLAVNLLEGLGYQVLQAPDGWAALVILEESSPPDLLLSDVVLPRGLSGPDLAEQVKRELPAIKVLFMSGYAEHAACHNDLAGNGAALLHKPFRKQELALKVRSVLDR